MKTASLEEVCSLITDGTHYTPPDAGSGMPFLTVKDMGANGIDFVGCSKIDRSEFDKAKSQNCVPIDGDVLFSKDGTVGKVCVVRRLPQFAVLSSIAILRPSNNILHPEYLAHFLRTPAALAAAVQRKTGSALTRIILKDIKQLRVPLVPLSEQKRVAAILDQANKVRRKRRDSVDYLDLLLHSTFVSLFGDPYAESDRWPYVTLGEFFQFRTGKLDSNAATPAGKFPFFTCAKEDFWIDTYAFDCEALLLAGNNANADYSVKHYKGKFNAYQRTYVITLRDEVHSYHYAKSALQYRLLELKRLSKGTNTKYLTLGLLNDIRIQLPPVTLQRRFAECASGIEKLKLGMTDHLRSLDTLFASLQDRAFRGDLTTKTAEPVLAEAS